MTAPRLSQTHWSSPKLTAGTPRTPDTAVARVCLLIVCGLLLLSAWLRGPGWAARGFASNDVGGILVNARILEDGGLPYVDTVELKSPGTFYVAAALVDHGPDAVVALTWWANAVALGSLALCAAFAWRWFGPRAAVVCVVLLGLHDAWLDSMDANYVTWANLPTIVAGGLAMEARRLPVASWRRRGVWFASGVMAAVATLCKTPAGIVFVAAAAMLVLDTWSSRPAAVAGPDGRVGNATGWRLLAGDLSMLCAGVIAGHLPVVLHYASRGALDTLAASYPVSSWVTSYVARRATSPWVAARELVFASVHHLALLLVLAGLRVVWWRRSEALASSDDAVLPLLVWAAAMLLAASVGLRFYKGYFVSVAPPLALLASSAWAGRARPLLPSWRHGIGRRASPAWVARGLAVVVLGALVARQGAIAMQARTERASVMDAGARRLGEWIAAHSANDDRIWVWGWHLWPVYSYADRRPASVVYKSLGLLTPANDDTWRSPATRLTFVDGPWSERVITDLERAAPRFIVLGGTVPHRDFRALRSLLWRDYRRVTALRVGRVELWERRVDEPAAGGR